MPSKPARVAAETAASEPTPGPCWVSAPPSISAAPACASEDGWNDAGTVAKNALIVAAFVISTALRVAQGSATVALTTTAGLIAPTVAATTGLSEFDRCFLVIAIASGATVLSHFNDSGFWLVGRFLNMDEKTTLRTWTVMETLLGSIGFVLALIGWWLL